MTTNNGLWKQFSFISSSFCPQTQNEINNMYNSIRFKYTKLITSDYLISR